MCQVLLSQKTDVEDRGSKGDRTPLMEAAYRGHLDIVRLLLAYKADVNAQVVAIKPVPKADEVAPPETGTYQKTKISDAAILTFVE